MIAVTHKRAKAAVRRFRDLKQGCAFRFKYDIGFGSGLTYLVLGLRAVSVPSGSHVLGLNEEWVQDLEVEIASSAELVVEWPDEAEVG